MVKTYIGWMGFTPFYRELVVGSTCLDPPPSWMMLVVNKENWLYGVKCVEFFPRIKQRVMLCLCEANGVFSAEFTKYNLVVHVLSRW